MSWEKLRTTDGYRELDMEQVVKCPQGTPLATLRCPIRIDGEIFKSPIGAPAIGQHNAGILREFEIKTGSQALAATSKKTNQ
jgi:crotonobetainyl-CoA:carnitine CoA-transferase CaiB-like acyl-CoA transferase